MQLYVWPVVLNLNKKFPHHAISLAESVENAREMLRKNFNLANRHDAFVWKMIEEENPSIYTNEVSIFFNAPE